MSLKAFHIVFVIVCTLFGAGYAAWGFREYSTTRDPMMLVLGIGSLLAAGAMIFYGGWFLKKSKGMGYL